MQLTLLGSGTAVPDLDRGPAGLLVQAGGTSILVDGGSGTLQRCARAGQDPRLLDAGVYSHHHPDHCADLVPLLFAMRVGPPKRIRDYPIYAGEGFGTFFSGLQSTWGKWMEPGDGKVLLTELSIVSPMQVRIGPVTLRTLPANHTAGALHLRFEHDGGSVVFSGDTGPSDNLAALAEGADLLVCECAGSDDQPIEGHLTPSEVARIVKQARPSQVWLTHLYPFVDPELALATVARAGVPVRRADDLDRFVTPTRS